MSNNHPSSINLLNYTFIDFNFYYPQIETSIINHLNDVGEYSPTLGKIKHDLYYEILNTYLNNPYKTFPNTVIPVFSKLTHTPFFDFCSLIEFENFIFQLINKIISVSPLSVVYNQYATYTEFALLPLADKLSSIKKGKHKSLKSFYSFLNDCNLDSFAKRIKANPSEQKLLFNS